MDDDDVDDQPAPSLLMAFRECPECGAAVGVLWMDDPADIAVITGCKDHGR